MSTETLPQSPSEQSPSVDIDASFKADQAALDGSWEQFTVDSPQTSEHEFSDGLERNGVEKIGDRLKAKTGALRLAISKSMVDRPGEPTTPRDKYFQSIISKDKAPSMGIKSSVEAARRADSPFTPHEDLVDRFHGQFTRDIAEDAAKTEREAEKTRASEKVASELHEQWRETRKQEDGSFEGRIKSTKDEEWINKNGTDQVDIANTEYEDLPEDWKKENLEAAKVVVELLDEHGRLDLSSETARNFVGDIIHQKWLERNEWAKDGELGVPFEELPKDEQEKYINQYQTAIDQLY